MMMIDFSTPDGFCSESIDGQTLVNNASGLAKAAKIFNVPTILTTVAEKSFSGPTFAQIKKYSQNRKSLIKPLRTPLEDEKVVDAFKKTGREKISLSRSMD
jgi:nicotinamidase-related amidase